MKRRSLRILAVLLLALPTVLRAAESRPAASPAAGEADTRLHADGKGWGLDKGARDV